MQGGTLDGPSRWPRLRDGIISRWIEGEQALHDPATDTTLLLNASASAVLGLLDGRRSSTEAVAELAEVFRDPLAAVRGVIDDLERRGFLEPCERRSWTLDLPGARVRIETGELELLDALERCFSSTSLSSEGAAPDLTVRLSAERGPDRTYVMQTDPPNVLDRLGAATCRVPEHLCGVFGSWFATRESPYHVFHAGAVARGERALLLPASSMSGKSTLTAALLMRGFALLSDEVGAVAMGSGRMQGYPRRLSLRSDVLELLGLAPDAGDGSPGQVARMVEPEELGGVRAAGSPSLALVVCPCFRKDATLEVEELSPGRAVIALLESSCARSRLKERGLDWIIALVERVPVYRLVFPDLEQALCSIEDLWRLEVDRS